MKLAALSFAASAAWLYLQAWSAEAFAPKSPSFGVRFSSNRGNTSRFISSEASASSSANVESEQDEATVTRLNVPDTKQQVTIIGTAHLSKASNEQVIRVIKDVRPDVVMVELDRSRLERAKLSDIDDMGMEIVTSEDIIPPTMMESGNKQEGLFSGPSKIMKNMLLSAFSQVTRKLLTGMYNDMNEVVYKDDEKDEFSIGGGEFRAAVITARDIEECKKIVLADRDSLVTIRRAVELAIDGGKPLQVLGKFQEANGELIREAEKTIKDKWDIENPGKEMDEQTMSVSLMEFMKEDDSFRSRLFGKLEREVPEFTTAFLKERDYIMGESIVREIEGKAAHVVAVVGLAHARGMAAHLEKAWSKTKDL